MGKEFKEIKVNGKYLELSVVIPETASYRFKANITYPNLDINESAFKPIVRIQKSSQIEYDAVKGTEKEGMPLIEANGYQVSLKIREY
jgi:glutaredoxin-related protein